METTDRLRAQLSRLLEWEDAHVGFDKAVDGVPPELRGRRPAGSPHSPWELLEHMRLTQHDILDFCVNPSYVEPHWPTDYWPRDPAPPTPNAWDESIASFRRDRHELQRLATEPTLELFDTIPHGTGQTYIRELLVVADHDAYHIGQLVLTRRLLGSWPAAS